MLADGVEASSRTLSDPTPARVKQHVKNIIQARINDEQLDNCELTMSDLHRIEDAFVRVLSAIHHGRVKYPTDDDGKSVGEKSSDSKTSGSKTSGSKTSGSKSDKGEKEEGNSSDSTVTARRR